MSLRCVAPFSFTLLQDFGILCSSKQAPEICVRFMEDFVSLSQNLFVLDAEGPTERNREAHK